MPEADSVLAACPAALRPALADFLDGRLSAPLCVMHLLLAEADVAALGRTLTALHGVAEAAGDPRASRLHALGRLLDDNRDGARLVALTARDGFDHGRAAATVEAGIAACRDWFGRAARRSPEASVALYSLGSPALLDAATAEIVALLDRFGLLAANPDVLDLGCGIGRLTAALAGSVRSITGLDVSPEMIRTARQRCRDLGNVRLVEGTGRDLSPVAEAGTDLVVAVDVFPYLVLSGPDLAGRHVAEAARVLRPGGHLLVLNFSYRGDIEADRRDVRRLAAASGLAVERDGTRDLELWDGVTFLLRRPDRAVSRPAAR